MSEITQAEEDYVGALTVRQYRWLLHKARWEGMTIFSVLREHGKPPDHLQLRNDGTWAMPKRGAKDAH